MNISSAKMSDTGKTRERNEDYVWSDEAAGVFVVADGLGGHQAGDVASAITATTTGETIVERRRACPGDVSSKCIQELMAAAIETANQKVNAASSGQARPMGAVIVAAVVRPPFAYVSHAGDARAYLAHEDSLVRLTADDSEVAIMVAAGRLTQAEARKHPRRNVVTKIIGQIRPVEPSFREVEMDVDDWLILCSDGLWDMVDDEKILAELRQAGGKPERAVEALVRVANEAGGRDNISVLAVRLQYTP